jgi:hypothetical protein
MRRSHYDDEVQSVPVPTDEEVVRPIELWMLGSLADSPLQGGDHDGGLL